MGRRRDLIISRDEVGPSHSSRQNVGVGFAPALLSRPHKTSEASRMNDQHDEQARAQTRGYQHGDGWLPTTWWIGVAAVAVLTTLICLQL